MAVHEHIRDQVACIINHDALGLRGCDEPLDLLVIRHLDGFEIGTERQRLIQDINDPDFARHKITERAGFAGSRLTDNKNTKSH